MALRNADPSARASLDPMESAEPQPDSGVPDPGAGGPAEPNRKVTTYLEMTGPEQLVPGKPVVGLALERVDRTSPLIVEIGARIGAPYGWRHATRTADEWTEWLSHPDREYWLIRHESEIVGMADLEPQPDGEVEVTTFGLVPEHVGKGLGGHALTLVLRQAWRTEPRDTGSVRRVWLHTSSGDHPNALPNYRSRGLRPFRTRIWPGDRTDPQHEAGDDSSSAASAEPF